MQYFCKPKKIHTKVVPINLHEIHIVLQDISFLNLRPYHVSAITEKKLTNRNVLNNKIVDGE